MRSSRHPLQRRLILSRAAPLLAITASGGLLMPPARAQSDLFVTSNRTIAGGNPINGDYARIVVGRNALNTAFPNVVAEITGGSSTDDLFATNLSLLTIRGGTFGRVSGAAASYTALSVMLGSTVNMTGGTLRSSASVGNLFSDDGTTSTFNLSGGAVPYIFNRYGGVVNMTGGSVLGGAGFSTGVVGNYATGALNISGGTMNLAGNVGYEDGAVTRFGGSAVTNTLRADNGTLYMTGGTAGALTVGGFYGSAVAYVSGGSVGSGGITVGLGGQANVLGSGLSVLQTATRRYFDDNYYQNFVGATYTVAGTLSDGLALNTTLTGGSVFANTGSLATFEAPTLAPDLFVSADQVVSGFYNNVNVGVDEDFNPYSPTVTIADGNDTVFLSTFGGSATTIAGGIIRGDLYAGEQSQVTIAGGEIDGGLYAMGDSAVTVRGGAFYGYGVYLSENASLTVEGTGVSASGSVGPLWDPIYEVNYIAAGNFQVTATLADGNLLDQSIIAGGASGDSTRQTLIAPVAAPDLHIEQNATVDAIQNNVFVGQAGGSPTVEFQGGANTGNVFASNHSALEIDGGVVNGTIYAGKDVKLDIRGGVVDRVYQAYTGVATDGVITVSGGSTSYIAPSNRMRVTGGQLTTLDTYAGAQVQITGGDITNLWVYGNSSARGDVSILGGSVGTILGYGGAVNIFGGNVGAGYLYNLTGSPFTLIGLNFSIRNAMSGTYQGRNGVWWDVSGLLQGGQSLSTRYFEAGGSVSGPANLRTVAAVAPEPGSLALMAVPVALAGVFRRRSIRRRQTRRGPRTIA